MVKTCIISTPQFNSNGSIKEMKKQTGYIDTDTWIFEPDNILGGHKVFFHTEKSFNIAEAAAKK